MSRLAAFAIAAACCLTALPAAAQTSYPLTCRGGGTMTIANNGGGGVAISFEPGPGAAVSGLAPGQCTWSDRALRPGEPTAVCDTGVSAASYVGLLVQDTQYAIFQVYNDGAGCMIVTRVGP